MIKPETRAKIEALHYNGAPSLLHEHLRECFIKGFQDMEASGNSDLVDSIIDALSTEQMEYVIQMISCDPKVKAIWDKNDAANA